MLEIVVVVVVNEHHFYFILFDFWLYGYMCVDFFRFGFAFFFLLCFIIRSFFVFIYYCFYREHPSLLELFAKYVQ